jgi:hypothetical protein
MTAKKRDWVVALCYVALIYGTLEVARMPLAALRAHGFLRLSLGILFLVTLSACIVLIVHHHSISLWRLGCMGLIAALYYFAAGVAQTPEEQIHFFEYGLVGIFFLRALSHHIPNGWKLWAVALLLATAAGWCDEFLQGLTPHRHYDLRDVGLNAISAALGLLTYLISRPSNSPLKINT